MKTDYILVFLAVVLVLISGYNVYEISSLKQNIHSCPSTNKSTHVDIKPVSHNFASITRTIPIVAVSNNGEGIVENLTVRLIPGNNNVLINTNPFLQTDIQYSANKAVAVAKLNSNYSYDKDFIFDFKSGNTQLIGGESAGAAITIATIAALQNKKIKNDAVITGTINIDGTIGRIGGVIEKAKAVADAGYKYFLIPKGQSKVTYYEKQIVKEPFGFGFDILNTRYVPKTIDLKKIAKKEWGLNIVEVSSIEDAIPYFLE